MRASLSPTPTRSLPHAGERLPMQLLLRQRRQRNAGLVTERSWRRSAQKWVCSWPRLLGTMDYGLDKIKMQQLEEALALDEVAAKVIDEATGGGAE